MSGRILRLKSTEFIQQPVFYKGFTARRQATLSLHSTECIWQLELSRQGKKRSALRQYDASLWVRAESTEEKDLR